MLYPAKAVVGFKSELCKIIREEVVKTGDTQDKIAFRLGITQAELSRIINGKAYGTSTEKLLNLVVRMGKTFTVRFGDEMDVKLMKILKISDAEDEAV